MKIGAFIVAFADKPLEETLDYVKSLGVEAIEVGTGCYPGSPHCDLDQLLEHESARKTFKKTVEKRGLVISALSCHGNPLHPNSEIAKGHHEIMVKTIKLAQLLEVNNVVNFSGCPGYSDSSKYPNWVTCPWPTDFTDILNWQWNEKVIPYWKETGKLAEEHNVRICLEMHPGFVVYNPETLMKPRDAAGDMIGANFDPSHLFWQGIDPAKALRGLKDCIFHFHAKDCKIYNWNSDVNGVLDTKSYLDEIHRTWIFRTVGYGHGADVWKDIISTLVLIGYDGALSIEHEDSLMTQMEGFEKAVAFLKDVIIRDRLAGAWWT